jgi:hypothetical protein
MAAWVRPSAECFGQARPSSAGPTTRRRRGHPGLHRVGDDLSLKLGIDLLEGANCRDGNSRAPVAPGWELGAFIVPAGWNTLPATSAARGARLAGWPPKLGWSSYPAARVLLQSIPSFAPELTFFDQRARCAGSRHRPLGRTTRGVALTRRKGGAATSGGRST